MSYFRLIVCFLFVLLIACARSAWSETTLSFANGSSLTFESITRDGAKLKCKSPVGIMEYGVDALTPAERAKYFPETQPAPTPTPTPAEKVTNSSVAASSSPIASPITSAIASPTPAASPSPASVPKPAPLTIYAIWEGINDPKLSEKEIREMMDNLLNQFGKGNAWHRPGFAFIYNNPERLELAASIAKEKGVSLGPIIGMQTHTRPRSEHDELSQDLRSYQWRMNTPHWQGYFTSTNDGGGDFANQTVGRDYLVPSPSRYSPLGRQIFTSETRRRAEEIRGVMDKYPGIITCINGLIEEELAIAASSVKKHPETADYLADYSPFAITEFRDWIRHCGLYDDDRGLYAGQGAPESITGPFIDWKGKKRSPYYFDKSPDSHQGSGESFNKHFGTSFICWNLKYWDTEIFPDPITDVNFNPMPKSGEQGYTEGGFDAPRHPDRSPWWRAWSWDYYDEGKSYPPGHPSNPAFGFRQQEVANYVRDMFDVMAEAKLPREIMYAHQIPSDNIGNGPRDLSAASPVWTGYLPKSGTVGITSFGWFDPKLALQYTSLTPDNHGWGIFEWHPLPGSAPDDQKLYDTAMKELLIYSSNNCHHLNAGWWDDKDSDSPTRRKFPMNDSKFAEAIKAFMNSTPDSPPPMPKDVLMNIEHNDHLIN